MEPLVSVVIPIYNVEKYLDRCILSVVNQTYHNLEIILVDDGSPDNCPTMCDCWAQENPRIRVIHKKNAGLGMARNSGIEEAKGKYVCFFDSDDYVDLATVEKCVTSAEKYCADSVVFGRWDAFEDGRVKRKYISSEKCLFQGEEIQDQLLPSMLTYGRGFGVSACCTMYRSSVLRDHNLRFHSEREIISEDTYFALEFCSKAKTVAVVPENLYYYYSRSTSLTKQYREDRQSKNDAFLLQCMEYVRRNKLPKVVESHLCVRYHFVTVAALKQTLTAKLSEKERKRAIKQILSSSILRGSLKWEVLKLENWKLRLFFTALKFRAHWLCYLLLKYKMRSVD